MACRRPLLLMTRIPHPRGLQWQASSLVSPQRHLRDGQTQRRQRSPSPAPPGKHCLPPPQRCHPRPGATTIEHQDHEDMFSLSRQRRWQSVSRYGNTRLSQRQALPTPPTMDSGEKTDKTASVAAATAPGVGGQEGEGATFPWWRYGKGGERARQADASSGHLTSSMGWAPAAWRRRCGQHQIKPT